ncbi:hypothetical protein [Bradyrhizobium canariense]|uniref:hypothetical protein n=1 Tax=Bradyrhizobium canariense TaxID=255045 RepID=UPI0024BF62B4|nr:hypothetical protein [Bradyrhizobium canariense]
MTARTGHSLHQLTKGRLLAIDDIDHQLEAAGDAVRAAGIDQMTGKGIVEVKP